jgi:hypothetical protein
VWAHEECPARQLLTALCVGGMVLARGIVAMRQGRLVATRI